MKRLRVEKTASDGIAAGKVYIHRELDLTPCQQNVTEENVQKEVERFLQAKKEVLADLDKLAQKSEIFQAHAVMADDFTLEDGIVTKIREEKYNAELALDQTVQEIAAIFEMMDDEYMRERAADVKDVAKRFMARLKGQELSDFSDISEPVILVARDLYPSDTAGLDLNFVKGFITQEGGVTSHVSIMAKGAGLPALVGATGILEAVQEDSYICMDAKTGEIVIDPDEEEKERFIKKAEEFRVRKELYEKVSTLPACTVDGREVHICANVGNLEDVKTAVERNVHGIGLFRSEFLYMENDHFPTEEEQYQVYSEAAKASPRELTIRTLDIGGDKGLSYYNFEKEENPFLGWRAIRISLELRDMFKTQLRAVLRASAFGHVRIMFPMIISLEELRQAKDLVQECKEELDHENLAYDPDIRLGMMMETPASVLLADEFAAEADFFSIGTNDLTQYTLAVDRQNAKLSDFFDPHHEAVLRMIRIAVDNAHKYGKRIGICGELGADLDLTEEFLRIGLDELSVEPSMVLRVRKAVREAKV